MVDQNDPVAVAILSLLSLITIILTGYLSLYCYAHYKSKQGKFPKLSTSSFWLNSERKPLVPGNIHTQPIQPLPPPSKENYDEDSLDEIDLHTIKERDYSELGRIIFVMRYNKKREELMVRLVQIEGMPVSQELYCPNSAYVDVGLKYTGNPATKDMSNQKPPRLDICLQQVYYFIISTQQMMSHALEFRINTFDDEFRRYVCGLVEVNLSDEMGEDIFSGNEVVFVKEIEAPFRVSNAKLDSNDKFTSVSSIEQMSKEKPSRTRSSSSSSNMSWEPEVSKELLSASTSDLRYRCTSMQDINLYDIDESKRAHSIGYLPAYEWTVKDISLEEDIPESPLENNGEIERASPEHFNMPNLTLGKNIDTTPESFYHIVPITPLTPLCHSGARKYDFNEMTGHRRIAYKKIPNKMLLARSLTMKHSAMNNKLKKSIPNVCIERSSSCPSLSTSEKESQPEKSSDCQYGNLYE